MELYHLHIKGIKDYFWKENKEFVIDHNFKNRLYEKCYSNTASIRTEKYPELTSIFNCYMMKNNFQTLGEIAPINYLMDACVNNPVKRGVLINLISDASDIIYNSLIFSREMALENYRLKKFSDLPSRLNCIYATDEDGIDLWRNMLIDGDLELFRIEVSDTPFLTNSLYLPDTNCSYGEAYAAAFKYWHPNLKNDNSKYREYLVQGKVKIKEKVDEFEKSRLIV